DIISYNDQQYMRMTDEQLQEVQSAQRKKNRLTAALAEDLQKVQARSSASIMKTDYYPNGDIIPFLRSFLLFS
ncbi:MAG: hypothetical protein IKZ16_01235, partial [Clostridia bacterium]|nr:hypothetical protein [Clostridia bacterium]